MSSAWFGNLPGNWRAAPLKRLVTFTAGGTPDTEEPDYWCDPEVGTPWVAIGDMSRAAVVTQTERAVTPAGQRSKSLAVANVGSILFAMYASVGATSVLGINAAFNQALLALTPNGMVDARFIRYTLEAIRPHLGGMVRSNTQDNLNANQVANLLMPLPASAVQRTIADFLDRETAQIDAMIQAQRTLADRLEERKLAIITNSVSVADASPLKRWWRVIDCLHITAPFTDDSEYFVASIGQLGGREIDLSGAHSTTPEAFANLRGEGRAPVAGDVVMSRNATVGATSIVTTKTPQFALGQDVVVMKPRGSADGAFLQYALMSGLGAQQLANAMVGSTFKRVNVAQIKALRLPFPSPAEQREIARGLDRRTSDMNALINAANESIVLMQERRSALISAAVTGRIDPCTGKEITPEKVLEFA